MRYGIDEARKDGIIADFEWEVWHAPAAQSGVETLVEQTETCVKYHDETTGELDLAALDIEIPEDIDNDFQTYDELRSFVQTNAGRNRRSESDRFDEFASAILTRRTARWNLVPDDESITDLIARHGSGRKCVVLVRGYASGEALRESLVDQRGFDPEQIIALEGPKDRMEGIERFNETENAIVIGPGRLLGIGVDMPDAEVAINVAARGGVNPSLVQRIGRVLRNPDGTKEARFYHVLAQPLSDEAIVPGEDGQRLLKRISEFRALGTRIDERPTFDAMEGTIPVLARLERAGNESLNRYQKPLTGLIESEGVREELHELRGMLRKADHSERIPLYIQHWGSEPRTREANAEQRGVNRSPTTDQSQAKDDEDSGSKSDSTDRDSKPMSESKEALTPTDGGNEIEMSKSAGEQGAEVEEYVHDLIRIALNEMSGVGDTETRERAVDGLADYGTREGLREIAQNSEDEAVAKRAEARLAELLIDRISAPESKNE